MVSTPTRLSASRFSLISLALALSAACGPGTMMPGDGSTADAATTPEAAAPRCSATPPACTDEQVMTLRLFTTVNPAVVEAETAPAGEFVTHIDASAGGMTPRQSFVYARFTPTGLEKVNISDEQAFTSLDWDISFRRFVVRLNSGVSGPSCVDGARLTPGVTFASVASAPETLSYEPEAYFNASCSLVDDGSGIGSPGTVLSNFWTYGMCVSMNHYVYVLRLRDGRRVKLEVLSYYDPAAQEQCDTVGTVPSPNGAGNLRVRWAFLP